MIARGARSSTAWERAQPLGDDGALDLVRAGVDRPCQGEQEAAAPGVVDLGERP